MKKYLYCCVMLFIGSISPLLGLQMALAPLHVEGMDIDGLQAAHTIAEFMNGMDAKGIFHLSVLTEGPSPSPSIMLDAAEWSEYHRLDLLIYGRLALSEEDIDGELFIYDAKGSVVHEAIISRDKKGWENRLLEDLSEKLYSYLADRMHLATPVDYRPVEKSQVDMAMGLGWWTPTGQWADVIMGLGAVHIGLGLTPQRPIAFWNNREFFIRLGLDFSYALGKNRDGFEISFLHILGLGLSVDFCLEWNQEHQIRLSMAPILHLDYLSRHKKYGTWTNTWEVSGGGTVSLSYLFRIHQASTIGIRNDFSLMFFSPVGIVYRPTIFYTYTFPGRRSS